MTFDRFQGDPRLVIDDDGSTISVKGGQPVMDQGLENVPLIDLFTAPDWWGNALFQNTTQQIGSDFEEVAREAATLQGLNNTEAAAKRATQHMVDEGLASDVQVSARNPSGGRVEIGLLIQPPGRDLLALLATKHGSNWTAQLANPASERL
jgi:phage gp46-like protein